MSWSRLLQSDRDTVRGLVDDEDTLGCEVVNLSSDNGVIYHTGVNALPDEIVVLIFSKVEDGATLLDNVPLVCKRWCRLARDPASWAGVELTLTDQLVAETRVLLHAPAAKSLTIDPWLAGHPTRRVAQLVRSVLRRTRVAVRAVSVLENRRVKQEQGLQADILHCLVWRSELLTELRLHLSHHVDCDYTWVGVSELRCLRVLEVETAPGVAYNGELRGQLRDLRVLVLHARRPRDPADPALPCGLVGDLVRGAKALRVLDVDMPVGDDREACAALRAVEHVELNAFQEGGMLRPCGPAAFHVVRVAFALLEEMETPALRTAVIALSRGEHARYPRWLQRDCCAMLRKLSLRMPRVAVELEMDGPGCKQCRLVPDKCPGRRWLYDEEVAMEAVWDGHLEDNLLEGDYLEDDFESDFEGELNGNIESDLEGDVEGDPEAAPEGDLVDDGGEDARTESDSEESIAEMEEVLDYESEVSSDFVRDDFCDSDCECCASEMGSTEEPTVSEPETDPEMYYPCDL